MPYDYLVSGSQLNSALQGLTLPPRAAVGEFITWNGFSGNTNAALVSGKAAMHMVQLRADTYDAIEFVLAVAQVGGATTTKVAIYADNGNSAPLMDGTGPLAVGTADLNAAAIGTIVVTFGSPVTLATGQYWLALSYVATTVPTTAPQVSMISGAVSNLPIPAGTSPVTRLRGRTRTGLTDMPSDNLAWVVSGANDVPIMAIRRSA